LLKTRCDILKLRETPTLQKENYNYYPSLKEEMETQGNDLESKNVIARDNPQPSF